MRESYMALGAPFPKFGPWDEKIFLMRREITLPPSMGVQTEYFVPYAMHAECLRALAKVKDHIH